MTIALDVRFKVRSGGSTHITQLLPRLLEQSDREFVLVQYAGQELGQLPREVPRIVVPALSAIRELWWMHTALPRELEKHGVALYHGMKLFGPANLHCPCIHTAHSITKRDREVFPLTSARQVYFSLYGTRLFRKSEYVIAVSEFVADFVTRRLKIPPSRVVVIYNGLDERFRERQGRSESADTANRVHPRPFILCVGNVFPVKNHLTAIKAFARIKGRIPHDLLIAGDCETELATELRGLAKELGVADRVQFLGFTGVDELAELYRQASVLLHPSLTEGFGLTAVEAMANGLPIVATDCGALKEICRKAARFVGNPMDDGAFSDLLQRVLSNAALSESMAAAGRQRAEDFQWPAIADQTLVVYERCLEPAAEPGEQGVTSSHPTGVAG